MALGSRPRTSHLDSFLDKVLATAAHIPTLSPEEAQSELLCLLNRYIPNRRIEQVDPLLRALRIPSRVSPVSSEAEWRLLWQLAAKRHASVSERHVPDFSKKPRTLALTQDFNDAVSVAPISEDLSYKLPVHIAQGWKVFKTSSERKAEMIRLQHTLEESNATLQVRPDAQMNIPPLVGSSCQS